MSNLNLNKESVNTSNEGNTYHATGEMETWRQRVDREERQSAELKRHGEHIRRWFMERQKDPFECEAHLIPFSVTDGRKAPNMFTSANRDPKDPNRFADMSLSAKVLNMIMSSTNIFGYPVKWSAEIMHAHYLNETDKQTRDRHFPHLRGTDDVYVTLDEFEKVAFSPRVLTHELIDGKSFFYFEG